jgi:hypothetical protein
VVGGETWRATVAIRVWHPKGKPVRIEIEQAQRMFVQQNSPRFGTWLWRKYIRPGIVDMELGRYSVSYVPPKTGRVRKAGESNE